MAETKSPNRLADLLARYPESFGPEAAAKREAEAAEQQRLWARDRRWKAIESLGLPLTTADLHRILNDDFDRSVKAFAAVDAWMRSEEPWLILLGATGRGKTLAAGWALVERGGAYVGARELERLATARYGDEAEKFGALLTTHTLVVDDIGRERDAGNMTAALLDLVDERRKHRRRTIAISNIAKPAFLKAYSDERLISRLAEPGIAVWIADAGEDLRRRKQ